MKTSVTEPVFAVFENRIKNKQDEVETTMADLVVVKAKIKEHAKGMNVSADFADALSQRVVQMIKDAAARAKANKRQTVKARDV